MARTCGHFDGMSPLDEDDDTTHEAPREFVLARNQPKKTDTQLETSFWLQKIQVNKKRREAVVFEVVMLLRREHS